MSWVMNHMRHFVLPGIHTLARSGGKTLTADDIKPRERQVRPSQKCKYPEAGLLYALVSSVLKKGDPLREVAMGLCRQIGRASDAEFVYEIDSKGRVKKLGEHYDGVEGSDVLHSMLCNSMRRLKRKMRKNDSLLLPGRDVWCWEVMARKLTVDSVYDARVSRNVARSPSAIRTCIDEWRVEDWEKILFFDTGFAGSIPKAIAQAAGLAEVNMLLLSATVNERQIFRTHTGSRAKALAFEYLAKYQCSGKSRDGQPYQELASLEEFIKAALLTIWLWYHVSPQRLPSYRAQKIKPPKTKSTPKFYTSDDLSITNPNNIYFQGNGQNWTVMGSSTDTFAPVMSASSAVTPMLLSTTDNTWGSAAWNSAYVSPWSGGSTAVPTDTPQPGLVDQVQLGLVDQIKKEVDLDIINQIKKAAIMKPTSVPIKPVIVDDTPLTG